MYPFTVSCSLQIIDIDTVVIIEKDILSFYYFAEFRERNRSI